MIKVSIIIPVYNVEEYLRECLDSVVRQTLKEIEIICINDGSTDNSLDILNEYSQKDKRITIINKENGGYGLAMNIGVEKAQGEYVAIVEPDDYVSLNMFEDLYFQASKNKLDLIKADFYRFKRDAKTGNMELLYNKLDKTNNYYNRIINPQEEPEISKMTINTWAGIYKRKFLEKYKIKHNETPGASYQDIGFFWQTLIYAKKVMYINKPYYMNRRDNPNSSSYRKDKVYAVNIEYDFVRDITRKNKKLWEIFKSYIMLKEFGAYDFTLKRISDDDKEEYIKYVNVELKNALDSGEFDLDICSNYEKERILMLINNPDDYLRKYYLSVEKSNTDIASSKKIKELEKKIVDIKNSETYRLGRFLLFVPRKIKKAIKKMIKS